MKFKAIFAAILAFLTLPSAIFAMEEGMSDASVYTQERLIDKNTPLTDAELINMGIQASLADEEDRQLSAIFPSQPAPLISHSETQPSSAAPTQAEPSSQELRRLRLQHFQNFDSQQNSMPSSIKAPKEEILEPTSSDEETPTPIKEGKQEVEEEASNTTYSPVTSLPVAMATHKPIKKDEQEVAKEKLSFFGRVFLLLKKFIPQSKSNNKTMRVLSGIDCSDELLLPIAKLVDWSEARKYIKENIVPSKTTFCYQPNAHDPTPDTNLLTLSNNHLIAFCTFATTKIESIISCLEIWDIKNQELLYTYKHTDTGTINFLHFTDDGRYLILLARKRLVIIIDTEKKCIYKKLQLPTTTSSTDGFNSVAAATIDEIILAINDPQHVEITKISKDTTCSTLLSIPPQVENLYWNTSMLSPHGKYVATSDNGDAIFVWDTANQTPLWKCEQSYKDVYPTYAFSPNEKYLAIHWSPPYKKGINKVIIYDLSTGLPISDFCLSGQSWPPVWNNTSTVLATIVQHDLQNNPVLWDIQTGALIRALDTRLQEREGRRNTYTNPSNTAVNNEHLVTAYYTKKEINVFSNINYLTDQGMTDVEQKLFDDTQLNPVQIILLKALLNQLTKAAKKGRKFKLTMADAVLFMKLPQPIREFFEKNIKFSLLKSPSAAQASDIVSLPYDERLVTMANQVDQ